MTRNFLEFADTVPGVVFEVDGKGRTSIRGGAQNENGVNLYIDGVGQKGYVRSGVSGQAGDTQGNPFPQLAIGEYKVITSNYKAEYDQISSAAITALTRSGTNEFEGRGIRHLYGRQLPRARRRASSPAARRPNPRARNTASPSAARSSRTSCISSSRTRPSVIRRRSPCWRTTARPRVSSTALPAQCLAQLGTGAIVFDEDLFFAKLDWALTRRGFTAGSPRRSATRRAPATRPAPASPPRPRSTPTTTTSAYELSWKHDGYGWLNEVQIDVRRRVLRAAHQRLGPERRVDTRYQNGPSDDPRIIAVDGADPRAGQNKGQKGWAIGDTITFTDITWLGGDHTSRPASSTRAST